MERKLGSIYSLFKTVKTIFLNDVYIWFFLYQTLSSLFIPKLVAMVMTCVIVYVAMVVSSKLVRKETLAVVGYYNDVVWLLLCMQRKVSVPWTEVSIRRWIKSLSCILFLQTWWGFKTHWVNFVSLPSLFEDCHLPFLWEGIENEQNPISQIYLWKWSLQTILNYTNRHDVWEEKIC